MNILHMGKWAKFGQPKMGSGRGQTQNFSSTGSIGSKSCGPQPSLERLPKPKMGSGRGQNQKWAPGGAKTKTVGPLGRKVVTPNPPFSASHGAERGVRGHNFSTQWSP